MVQSVRNHGLSAYLRRTVSSRIGGPAPPACFSASTVTPLRFFRTTTLRLDRPQPHPLPPDLPRYALMVTVRVTAGRPCKLL